MKQTTPEQKDALLRDRLNRETARVAWTELQRQYAAGNVVYVASGLDLVEIAVRLANDDKDVLAGLIAQQRVGKVTDAQAAGWLDAGAALWAVVVAPFVLVSPSRQRAAVPLSRPSTRSRTSTSCRPSPPACASSCGSRGIANNPKAPTFDNTIVAMERSGQLLARVSTVFSNLQTANTNDKLDAIDREMSPKLAAHNDAIYLNDKLFKRVETLYDKRDKLGWTPNRSTCSSATTRTSCAPAPSCPPPTRKS
jgi:hypothetical protein